MEINAPYTLRNPCHELIGNGLHPGSHLLYGQCRAENHHVIALLNARNISDIEHGHIHTNGADYWCQSPADHHFSRPVAKPARISVGVANADRSDQGIAANDTSAIVTHRIAPA